MQLSVQDTMLMVVIPFVSSQYPSPSTSCLIIFMFLSSMVPAFCVSSQCPSPSSSCFIILMFLSSVVPDSSTSRTLLPSLFKSTKISGIANFTRLLRLSIFSSLCNGDGALEVCSPPPTSFESRGCLCNDFCSATDGCSCNIGCIVLVGLIALISSAISIDDNAVVPISSSINFLTLIATLINVSNLTSFLK